MSDFLLDDFLCERQGNDLVRPMADDWCGRSYRIVYRYFPTSYPIRRIEIFPVIVLTRLSGRSH